MKPIKEQQLPTAVYAVAGAGDAAYEKLRHLPETAARVGRAAGETAGQFRQRLVVTPEPLRERVRASAERGTSAVITTAATAQQRVTTGYRDLVSRGERVIAERTGAGQEDDQAGVEVIVGPVQSERGDGAAGTDGDGAGGDRAGGDRAGGDRAGGNRAGGATAPGSESSSS